MMITSFKIYRYGLPLIRRLSFFKEKITAREGLIIKLTLDKGPEGFGEIAPLIGFSNNEIEECLRSLREVSSFLKREQFSCDTLERDLFEKLDRIYVRRIDERNTGPKDFSEGLG